MKSVLLAGGGTAGHVNPLLATAAELKRRHPGVQLCALGTKEGLEADLVPAAGLPLRTVPKVPLPRSVSTQWLRLPARLRRAVAAAEQAIIECAPDVVVGFGGYVSTPAYWAAHRARVPIVIHEANARPGLANRLGSRWAAGVATTFPRTVLPKAQLLGLPLRAPIASLDRAAERGAARAALDLDPNRPALLVTGGSLGAQRINETMRAVAGDLLDLPAQVLHLTGRGKADPVRAAVATLPAGYQVREYLEQMELAYAACDVVICRAGAGTVSELSAIGMPAVYVPLPIGNGEQHLNAADVVDAGGALMVADTDFTPAWARQHLLPMLTDADRLATMGAAAAGCGHRDGAQALVDLIEQVAA